MFKGPITLVSPVCVCPSVMEKTLREQPEKLEEIKSDVQKLLEKRECTETSQHKEFKTEAVHLKSIFLCTVCHILKKSIVKCTWLILKSIKKSLRLNTLILRLTLRL